MGATAPGHKKRGETLSPLEAAFGEYAVRQVSYYGRPFDAVVEELKKGGAPDLRADDLRAWMKSVARQTALGEGAVEDPLLGEEDEDKREQALEALYLDAAESVPGAAEILGVDRLRSAVVDTADFSPVPVGGSAARTESMAEVVGKCLDFLVPEIAAERYRIISTSLAIPQGGRFELWTQECPAQAPFESKVLRSTVVIYRASGEIAALHNFTRTMGRPKSFHRGLVVAARRAQLIVRADLRAVAQRLVQVALEFRPGRHEQLSQKEVAALCERTKQAISSQRGGIARRVLLATDGRAGFRGRRNLKAPTGSKKP